MQRQHSLPASSCFFTGFFSKNRGPYQRDANAEVLTDGTQTSSSLPVGVKHRGVVGDRFTRRSERNIPAAGRGPYRRDENAEKSMKLLFVEEAVEWLSKTLEPRLIRDIITNKAVSDACAKYGDTEKAVDWLSRAWKADLIFAIITYNAVIDACAKSAKAIDEAGQKLNIMTYSAAIDGSAKSDDMEEAVEWFYYQMIQTDVFFFTI